MHTQTRFDIITITDREQVKDELYAMRGDLFNLVWNAPTKGYGNGYDIVHILANHDPDLYETVPDGTHRSDGVHWDIAVDANNPLSLQIGHVEHWDDIQDCIDQMLDPFSMQEMTYGFFILAHDPERRR